MSKQRPPVTYTVTRVTFADGTVAEGDAIGPAITAWSRKPEVAAVFGRLIAAADQAEAAREAAIPDADVERLEHDARSLRAVPARRHG